MTKIKKKIETAIINYAKSVTDYEWINFKQKNKASIHNPEYLKLWESIHGLEIHTPLQKALLYSFIDDLNQVSKIRRHRIIDLNIKTSPVMWIFLFIGSAYLIFITFLYQKTHHRLINFVWMSQFTIIIYTFYLIWSYNDPHHSNYLKSSKKGMDMLIYTITTTPKNM